MCCYLKDVGEVVVSKILTLVSSTYRQTWDFVELDQDESYGDITIAPGLKFNEDPPSD